MKCYLINTHGSLRRVDKIKSIQDVLPKDTDYSRRVLLCSQNNLPFQPYNLEMNNSDFAELRKLVGDYSANRLENYQVFDNTGIIILNIINNGK